MRLPILTSLTVLGASAIPTAGAQAQLWIEQVGTADAEGIQACAPDGSGGLFVGGTTTGDFGGTNAGSGDAWCARYDALGNQAWVRQLGTSVNEGAEVAASDGADGLFLAGFTLGSLGGPHGGQSDVWLAHYDGSGNQTWITQMGSPEFDSVEDALPDGAGGVFVTGSTYGSLGAPHAGDADAWLAHYDSTGQQTWIEQWGTPRTNTSTALASDGAGGLFVTGYRALPAGGPSGDLDAWIARYDASGNRTWIQGFGTPRDDFARSATSDGAGGVYVTGFGGAGTSTGQDAWLVRFDGTGSLLWRQDAVTGDGDYSVVSAPDGSGGVIIGGSTYGSLGAANSGEWDAWLASYDETGNQVWIQQLGTAGGDSLMCAAADGMGGVFVTGSTNGALGGAPLGSADGWLARYSNLDATRYCSPANLNSTGQAGRLAVSGSSLAAANSIHLVASQLRPSSFGFFLASPEQGFMANPGGSQGNLCLGGAIGRYIEPGQIQSADAAGAIELSIDLTAMPSPTGPVAVQPGDTWNFQAWYRDVNPGPTSNLTDGMSVAFR